MPDLNCSFELFGFDVMVDSNLKPWLLEVNSGPAMSMDNNIDYLVKPDLIKDVLRLVHFQPYSEYLVAPLFPHSNLGPNQETRHPIAAHDAARGARPLCGEDRSLCETARGLVYRRGGKGAVQDRRHEADETHIPVRKTLMIYKAGESLCWTPANTRTSCSRLPASTAQTLRYPD